MGNPYNQPAASGYNASPPPDDGSKVVSNVVTWAAIKTKLADPLINFANAINAAVSAAFGTLFLNAVNPQGAAYTVAASDRGKLILVTNATTVSLLAAAAAGPGFAVALKNGGTALVTITPNGTDNLDNSAASITLNPGESIALVSDGGAWWSGATAVFVRWGVAGGGADTLTIANKPPVAGLVDGQLQFFRAAASNATTTPTLAVDGTGPFTITKQGGAALAAGDIVVLAEHACRYNLAHTRWELLNPKAGGVSFSGGTLTVLTQMSGAAFNEGFATIASGATTNIGAAAANYLQVTGTTTITAFDTVQAGTQRVLEFAAALTLTHNATSLILPGAANIVTAAGDVAVMRSEGAGNWRCVAYMKAAALTNGQLLIGSTGAQPVAAALTAGAGINVTNGAGSIAVASTLTTEASVASAATADLGAAGSNAITITGTTTITSFGSSANTNNPIYFLRFQGALTLTHNATNLICPGAASVAVQAGDTAIAKYEGSGHWRIVAYSPNEAKVRSSASIAGTYGTSGSKTTLIESMQLDDLGRVVGLSFVTGASYGGSGGGSGGTCFLLTAPVTMADGSKKPLMDVRIGERVRGAYGEANPVLALDRTTLGNRLMFWINREHWTSDEHPHMRPDRTFVSPNVNAIYAEWGKAHPIIVKGGTTESRINIGLPEGLVTQMRAGQALLKETGPVELASLDIGDAKDWPPETSLGNLVLGGSGTFIVDGYVVTGWPNHETFDYGTWKPK